MKRFHRSMSVDSNDCLYFEEARGRVFVKQKPGKGEDCRWLSIDWTSDFQRIIRISTEYKPIYKSSDKILLSLTQLEIASELLRERFESDQVVKDLVV